MPTRQAAAQTTKQVLHQRGAEATRNLRAALQLPVGVNDTTILGTALAEAAVREVRRNSQFASDVRRSYEELVQASGSRVSHARAVAAQRELPPLVPIRTDMPYRRSDPFSPPDPAYLVQAYGANQLGRALQEYTLDMLKQTADRIQAAHPGTKPKSRASKQSVIDYIVQYS